MNTRKLKLVPLTTGPGVRLFTVVEVARLLGCTRSNVYRYLDAGIIDRVTVKGKRYVNGRGYDTLRLIGVGAKGGRRGEERNTGTNRG